MPNRRDASAESQSGSAGEFLRQARQACEGGQYARAETILSQVVKQRPEIGAAWHLRGLVALRAGDPAGAVPFLVRAILSERMNARYCASLAEALAQLCRDADAVALWRRAIDLEPDDAGWQAAAARCLSRQGRYAEAIPFFRAALRLSPADPALHAACGYALQRQGRSGEAAHHYRSALDLDPLRHGARLNLAAALRDLGKEEAAAEQCREVLRHDPRSVSALNNLGAALCRLGRIEEAIRRLEAAMRLEPENMTTLHNLGVALDAAGATVEAEACLRRVLALQPDNPDAHRSLANLLRKAGRPEEASLHYRSVIERLPFDFRSYGNLGLLLLNLNRPQEAAAVYEKALALESGRADIRTSLGIAQLTAGNFEDGWANYEARWEGDRAPAWRPDHGAALWRGGTFGPRTEGEPGPTILVHAEQGFGDTLQFCRYLPLVAATGADVVFECQPSLKELMATLTEMPPAPRFRIVSRDEPAPHAEFHVPLLSLPKIFGTRLETIPAKLPYLAVPPAKAACWAAYPLSTGLNVGLVWSGNPERQDDHLRSCPPSALAPLFELESIRFYGLGKSAPHAPPGEVADLGAALADFGDTAAIMERLDLVVTVDTASAHLAGALGRPVWVMLGYAADWRYLLDREDSPWYPTMRLFRQGAPGDWLSVTRRIAEELRQYRRP